MSSKGQQLGNLAPKRELSFAKGRGIELFRVAAPRIHRVRDGRRGQRIADGRDRPDARIGPLCTPRVQIRYQRRVSVRGSQLIQIMWSFLAWREHIRCRREALK